MKLTPTAVLVGAVYLGIALVILTDLPAVLIPVISLAGAFYAVWALDERRPWR